MEFCARHELVNQTGHDVWEWPLVVVKELIDNGLDACEEVGITPIISVEVSGDRITIADNGPGIPPSVIDGVLDYSIRVSSREAYCSPTRGSQGNALKTILPMGYVLDEQSGEDASAVTIIEAHGIAHRIRFSVDHILQEPKITRLTRSSPVTEGTKITVRLPRVLLCDGVASALLRVAEAFAWINPHLTLHVAWNGKVKLDFQATDPTWRKWLPSWPTSAHWYDLGRFRRYMAAHIAHRGKITVREFISEFDGLSSTIKQKAVLAETDSSHTTLRKYFGVKKANTENIAKLLASIKAHTKPVKPATLGIIGRDHFYRRMEEAGGDPRTFTYNRALGITAGIPHVSEFAFGLHREGLLGMGDEPRRKVIRGVNWSAAINDPFRQIGQGGESLDSVLAAVKANTSQPIILALHVAKAHVAYTDRGKSAIVVEGEADDEEE
jgi:DNA topoisomerase VI subunit B